LNGAQWPRRNYRQTFARSLYNKVRRAASSAAGSAWMRSLPRSVVSSLRKPSQPARQKGIIIPRRHQKAVSPKRNPPAGLRPVAEASRALQPHYTVAELAKKWRISPSTALRLFKSEPDVLRIGNIRAKKRVKISLRIHQDVAERVHARLTGTQGYEIG